MGSGMSACSNLFVNHASCIPSLSCLHYTIPICLFINSQDFVLLLHSQHTYVQRENGAVCSCAHAYRMRDATAREPWRMSESWKKCAPRRVWRTVSPRGKTPGGVAFVNNDVEELRQRRIEAHLRGVMSPSGRPAAFERFAPSTFRPLYSRSAVVIGSHVLCRITNVVVQPCACLACETALIYILMTSSGVSSICELLVKTVLPTPHPYLLSLSFLLLWSAINTRLAVELAHCFTIGEAFSLKPTVLMMWAWLICIGSNFSGRASGTMTTPL